ncbi:hypothetical protein PUN28_008828 [Cardiocondyla obscurior]|uniref:Uncharacterized protein n=1 Tax=Cardiocondyla obscurior TaxID=286306 RepID=A0AAW2FSF9_9HYME
MLRLAKISVREAPTMARWNFCVRLVLFLLRKVKVCENKTKVKYATCNMCNKIHVREDIDNDWAIIRKHNRKAMDLLEHAQENFTRGARCTWNSSELFRTARMWLYVVSNEVLRLI